jgi:UDP-sugar transporter A1/2/3
MVFQMLQVALVVALILQGTVTSLLGRYTRLSVPAKGLYDVNNFILVSECIKLLLSGLVEASHGRLLRGLREHVLEERSQFLKSSVPALLYLISNTSLYMAITHLSLSLQTGLYQAKLILVAVMSYILLNRIYSLKQWCCLATLSAGVTMVALSEHTGSSAKDTDYESPNLFLGLLEMCVANVCSCAAGVYFEKVLKEDCKSIWPMARPLSMWMRNLHLSFFSLAIGILAYGWRSCSRTEAPMPFFHGFSVLVWTQAGLLAGGGLLASAVAVHLADILCSGDSVATIAQNTAEHLIALHALVWLDASAVPLNDRLSSSELHQNLLGADVRWVITDPSFVSQLGSIPAHCSVIWTSRNENPNCEPQSMPNRAYYSWTEVNPLA